MVEDGTARGMDRSNDLPLNLRLTFLLKNQIMRGKFSPGQKLPNEEELSVKFGVSRVTVRSALARLESQKLIVKNRPLGTFVSEDVPCRKQNIVSGGVHDIVRTAETFEVKCLGIRRIGIGEARIPNDLSIFFGQSNDIDLGWIQRIRLLKGTPIYYLENFLPIHLAEKMSVEELSHQPLLRLLKDKIDLKIDHGEMFIEAVAADEDLAELLEISIFEPLILAQVHYWLPEDQPLQMVSLYMKPEYFKYRVELDAKGFENI